MGNRHQLCLRHLLPLREIRRAFTDEGRWAKNKTAQNFVGSVTFYVELKVKRQSSCWNLDFPVPPSETGDPEVRWPGLINWAHLRHKKTGVGRKKVHFLHEQSTTLKLGILVLSRNLVEKKLWDPKTASQPKNCTREDVWMSSAAIKKQRAQGMGWQEQQEENKHLQEPRLHRQGLSAGLQRVMKGLSWNPLKQSLYRKRVKREWVSWKQSSKWRGSRK